MLFAREKVGMPAVEISDLDKNRIENLPGIFPLAFSDIPLN